MIDEDITIINKLGLHTRAAAKLVNIASGFQSKIEMKRQDTGQIANCKSIMGLLLIGAANGMTLRLLISGDDEHEAREAIVGLIKNCFGENE